MLLSTQTQHKISSQYIQVEIQQAFKLLHIHHSTRIFANPPANELRHPGPTLEPSLPNSPNPNNTTHPLPFINVCTREIHFPDLPPFFKDLINAGTSNYLLGLHSIPGVHSPWPGRMTAGSDPGYCPGSPQDAPNSRRAG